MFLKHLTTWLGLNCTVMFWFPNISAIGMQLEYSSNDDADTRGKLLQRKKNEFIRFNSSKQHEMAYNSEIPQQIFRSIELFVTPIKLSIIFNSNSPPDRVNCMSCHECVCLANVFFLYFCIHVFMCVCLSFRACLFELTENNNLYLCQNQLPLASHSSFCNSGQRNKSKLKPNVSRV